MLRQKNGSYRSYFQQNALNHHHNNICGFPSLIMIFKGRWFPIFLDLDVGLEEKIIIRIFSRGTWRSPNSPIYSKLLYTTENFKIKITTLRPYWKKYDQNYSKLLFTTENFKIKIILHHWNN